MIRHRAGNRPAPFARAFIAYNLLDCDLQPQPAIINFLTSCERTESGH
jgi:hypothetical protein